MLVLGIYHIVYKVVPLIFPVHLISCIVITILLTIFSILYFTSP